MDDQSAMKDVYLAISCKEQPFPGGQSVRVSPTSDCDRLTLMGLLSEVQYMMQVSTVIRVDPIPEMVEQFFDGYHTFEELYTYRSLYNALWVNSVAIDPSLDVHKSFKHSDGEPCFGGGWFVVVVELPTGQITNHYKEEIWEWFQIPEKPMANTWDGHTASEAVTRMIRFLVGNNSKPTKEN